MFRKLIPLFLAFVPICHCQAADTPSDLITLQIGDDAPDFKLPGIDGRDWTLADFDGSKVLIVYFTSNHCPVCHAMIRVLWISLKK